MEPWQGQKKPPCHWSPTLGLLVLARGRVGQCGVLLGQGGFFCPCHGSTFDLAGRVFKNKPAPTNLEVPPHRYVSDTRLLIGDDAA